MSNATVGYKIYNLNFLIPTLHLDIFSFIYSPTDALLSCHKDNIKIYIKTYIKTVVLI